MVKRREAGIAVTPGSGNEFAFLEVTVSPKDKVGLAGISRSRQLFPPRRDRRNAPARRELSSLFYRGGRRTSARWLLRSCLKATGPN